MWIGAPSPSPVLPCYNGITLCHTSHDNAHTTTHIILLLYAHTHTHAHTLSTINTIIINTAKQSKVFSCRKAVTRSGVAGMPVH